VTESGIVLPPGSTELLEYLKSVVAASGTEG
jgi:hypothetical protein